MSGRSGASAAADSASARATRRPGRAVRAVSTRSATGTGDRMSKHSRAARALGGSPPRRCTALVSSADGRPGVLEGGGPGSHRVPAGAHPGVQSRPAAHGASGSAARGVALGAPGSGGRLLEQLVEGIWHGASLPGGPRGRPVGSQPCSRSPATDVGASVESTRELWHRAAGSLREAGVPDPRGGCGMLLAHVTGRQRALLRMAGSSVSPEDSSVFAGLVGRRARRVPLQHLTGLAPFRHLELRSARGSSSPAPRPSSMVDHVLGFLEERHSETQDAGHSSPGAGHRHSGLRHPATGSGRAGTPDAPGLPARSWWISCTGSAALALSIATEVPGSRVLAVELAPSALEWARVNLAGQARPWPAAGQHGRDRGRRRDVVAGPEACSSHCAAGSTSWSPTRRTSRTALSPGRRRSRDHDPGLALYGGPDGLDVVRRLAVQAALLLRPGGLLVVEHADVQGEAAGESGVTGASACRGRGDPGPRSPTTSISRAGPGTPRPGRAPRRGPAVIQFDTGESAGARARARRRHGRPAPRRSSSGCRSTPTYGVAVDAFAPGAARSLADAKGRAALSVPVMVPRIATVAGIAVVGDAAARTDAGLLARGAHPGPAGAAHAGMVADRRRRAGRRADAAAPARPGAAGAHRSARRGRGRVRPGSQRPGVSHLRPSRRPRTRTSRCSSTPARFRRARRPRCSTSPAQQPRLVRAGPLDVAELRAVLPGPPRRAVSGAARGERRRLWRVRRTPLRPGARP